MGAPRRIPVIIGPTASGKSALGVEVARRAEPDGEIVTADAFQVYRGMDFGTAKPTLEERGGVPHHLIDMVDPGERFTVFDWLREAERVVADVRARGRTPIVVGGTHLYVKAFLEGLFEGPAADASVREALAGMPREAMRAELERVDPEAARRVHPNDVRRTIRALEVFRATGRPISAWQTQWDAEEHQRKDAVLVVVDRPVEVLNRRINARVKGMVERGLVAEARDLWARGGEAPQAAQALGYKQLFEHFEGRCTLEEAIERIKIETRRFAKNQRTWMRRLRTFPGTMWLDAEAIPVEEQASRVLTALVPAT